MAQVNKYTGTFTKKHGTRRTMNFVRISDLDEQQKAKVGLTTDRPGSQQGFLKPGFEIVYDLDEQGFRTFNWNAVVGQVQQQQMEF